LTTVAHFERPIELERESEHHPERPIELERESEHHPAGIVDDSCTL